jgi:hypothetical protein
MVALQIHRREEAQSAFDILHVECGRLQDGGARFHPTERWEQIPIKSRKQSVATNSFPILFRLISEASGQLAE